MINIYAPNIKAPKYIQQFLTHLKRNSQQTITLGDFNTLVSSVDCSFGRKVNNETAALNGTLDEMSLIGLYRTFQVPMEPSQEQFLSCNTKLV